MKFKCYSCKIIVLKKYVSYLVIMAILFCFQVVEDRAEEDLTLIITTTIIHSHIHFMEIQELLLQSFSEQATPLKHSLIWEVRNIGVI